MFSSDKILNYIKNYALREQKNQPQSMDGAPGCSTGRVNGRRSDAPPAGFVDRIRFLFRRSSTHIRFRL